MFWKKLSRKEIKETVFEALKKNSNYRNNKVLGVPATYLDEDEFYADAPFLKNAPFLSALVDNPNHIGCHTIAPDSSERIFSGTQQIEVRLIKTCAEQIMQAEENSIDGYVAPGGTEANIQALWIYRNFFMQNDFLEPKQIGVIYSEDSHYSMPKGCNLLGLQSVKINVDKVTRKLDLEHLESQLVLAKSNGINAFIVVLNMATTMFGSVDDIDPVLSIIKKNTTLYKAHIDAAFGGFIYPFTNPGNQLNFKHSEVNSITMDGHKMLQTPYGTGIFLIRKGYMQYAQTEEAKYVHGTDYTICGSRSGANAIAVWMVLMSHGSSGLSAKMEDLAMRTENLCNVFDDMGISYYRNPYLNIVTIKGDEIPKELAERYSLVADNWTSPNWWKIVVMPHVKQGILDAFINDLESIRLNY